MTRFYSNQVETSLMRSRRQAREVRFHEEALTLKPCLFSGIPPLEAPQAPPASLQRSCGHNQSATGAIENANCCASNSNVINPVALVADHFSTDSGERSDT